MPDPHSLRQRPPGRAPALIVLAAVLLSTSACNDLFSPDDDSRDRELKVLLIGSSLLSWNALPLTFSQMAEAASVELTLRENLLEGHGIEFFAEDVPTALTIQEEEWDYVVLGGGAFLAAYPDIDPGLVRGWYDMEASLSALKEKIQANHPGSRVVYMMPWAFENGVDWGDGTTDTYEEMQLKIRENCVRWASSLDITVAPAGMAWYTLIQEGQAPGYLHDEDMSHPNPRGSYLAAATILATVLGEGVEDASFDASLPSEEAFLLRAIASQTVLEESQLWNIRP